MRCFPGNHARTTEVLHSQTILLACNKCVCGGGYSARGCVYREGRDGGREGRWERDGVCKREVSSIRIIIVLHVFVYTYNISDLIT